INDYEWWQGLGMQRRGVITGMGAITPLGKSMDALYESQLTGRSGVGPIEHFNATRFPTTFAAQVKQFKLADHVQNPERWKAAGANSKFAAAAAQQTLADAGLLNDARVDHSRFGVYVGAGEGIHDFHNFFSLVAQNYDPQRRRVNTAGFGAGGLREFHPPAEFEQELHPAPAHSAALFDLRGPNFTCLTACAASSQAIGEALWQIRHGDADLMLAGGSHSMIHPLGVSGFNRLTALSTRNDAPQKASRPLH